LILLVAMKFSKNTLKETSLIEVSFKQFYHK